MINFRYHVVSLTAVFLALAIGLIVGTSALNGPLSDSLQHRVDSLTKSNDTLRQQTIQLEAEVSAQERSESGHRVSTERVILHAHGEPARHLASLAAPLLIPDLPVILWWPGRPQFDSPLFDDLCELADRLVVDTDEGFDDADLKRLLEVARRQTRALKQHLGLRA